MENKTYKDKREWDRKTKKQRKERGVCVTCGKRIPEPGFITCDACRKRSKVYQRKKKERSITDV